jgi:hypothetical protein
VSTDYSRLPALRVICSPHPACWDTRQAIQAHLQRARVERLLMAACARPQLLTVPAVKVSPGR